MEKQEIRTLPIKELRVTADEGGQTIEGHASVFDSWSETLGGLFPFKEKVNRGAFAKSIESDDIRALFNHDPNYVLGRNKSGTLELKENEHGLFVRILPPDTSWAKDLSVSISRGDISQMSFGFIVIKDEWRSEGGTDIRELKEVRLFDVSPVTFPAYTQTDVGVRALNGYKNYLEEKRAAKDKLEQDLNSRKKLKQQINKFKLL
jgi:HK97 family phage prohead protease